VTTSCELTPKIPVGRSRLHYAGQKQPALVRKLALHAIGAE
jgi:hypothetical protein